MSEVFSSHFFHKIILEKDIKNPPPNNSLKVTLELDILVERERERENLPMTLCP